MMVYYQQHRLIRTLSFNNYIFDAKRTKRLVMLNVGSI